jgi:Fe-S cluster assembly iron-binding protein IscA
MTERDTDIEFDFFEEPETREAARPERPPGTKPRGPRPPVRTPQGLTPLLRLVGLIAFAIVIVVLLVYAIQGCQSSSKHSKYDRYMSKVSEIAANSQAVGNRLSNLLTNRGIRAPAMQRQLAGLARDEEQAANAARAVEPPGRLRDEHLRMIDALQYRYSGIVGLSDALAQALKSKSSGAGALLEVPAQRLTASDVVWQDSFRTPSMQVLRNEGVGDIRVPNSVFVKNPDFFTATPLNALVTQLRGVNVTPTTGGLHGTNIVSTKATPRGTELSTSTRLPVVAGTDLGFEVTVEDSGDSPEVRIPVTLTITNGSKSIVKNARIDFINPKEQKTVVFRNIQLDSSFFASQSTSVKVTVQPVPSEANTSNNTSTYPVIFSLPQ